MLTVLRFIDLCLPQCHKDDRSSIWEGTCARVRVHTHARAHALDLCGNIPVHCIGIKLTFTETQIWRLTRVIDVDHLPNPFFTILSGGALLTAGECKF